MVYFYIIRAKDNDEVDIIGTFNQLDKGSRLWWGVDPATDETREWEVESLAYIKDETQRG